MTDEIYKPKTLKVVHQDKGVAAQRMLDLLVMYLPTALGLHTFLVRSPLEYSYELEKDSGEKLHCFRIRFDSKFTKCVEPSDLGIGIRKSSERNSLKQC